ncbi:hypothetical protein, partial [Mycobacterium sp. NAZ190054]|uniref:hypothetical protein n=1 Tax=Mycobacterium sp. NAZ190054 TaxID=1747766 RepID=UPI000AA0AF31
MTTQKITTQAELDEFRAGVREREASAAKRRDKPQLTPEDIRARVANPPQIAPVTGNPISPSVKAEATQAFIEMLAANAYDTPKTLATEEGVRAVENTWRTTETAVESHYAKWPEHRWFDMLQPADDLLRKPADDAANAFRFATAPCVPAIVATCKVTEPWVMHSPSDLDNAFAAIAGESHCDLQISGPTVIDGKRFQSCVAWFEHATTCKPKHGEHPDDPSVQMRIDDHARWAREFGLLRVFQTADFAGIKPRAVNSYIRCGLHAVCGSRARSEVCV